MPPPAIVIVALLPVKIIAVRAFCMQVRALPFLSIEVFPVQPFMERAAMVEHAVYYHAYPPFMRRLHKLGKQRVRRLQICQISRPCNIKGIVLPRIFRGDFFAHDSAKVWVNMVIILYIIFMVARGNKNRIQV